MRKKIIFICVLFQILLLTNTNSYCQMAATYAKAEKLCNEAAKKYDQLHCTESANYCRKMAAWNHCMVNALAGNFNSCGIEPLPQNAPKCEAATIGGSNNGSNSTSNTGGKPDPVKEMLQKEQQTQTEINNAQNAAKSTFENSVNSGKKESAAMVDATLAGVQNISDPKTSLVYSAVGLGVAGLMALNEKSEAKSLARLEELKTMKESLQTSSMLFNFMSGTTSYHITRLKVDKKKNGRINKVIRTDLYDISVSLIKIMNTADIITIYESVAFKNINSSADSCVISKITIPIHTIKSAQAYNGNYTNNYDYHIDSYDNYRYTELSNSSIEYAFSMLGDYPAMPSGLSDVYIETTGNSINITKKYFASRPNFSSLKDEDFEEGYTYSASSYMFVFYDFNNKIKDFVEYLNYIKI